MPYTQEELNKLPFYQNLIDKDEQYYLIKKQKLVQESDALGAANDGSQLVRHKNDGSILFFEDPYVNKLPDGLYMKFPYILYIILYYCVHIVIKALILGHFQICSILGNFHIYSLLGVFRIYMRY